MLDYGETMLVWTYWFRLRRDNVGMDIIVLDYGETMLVWTYCVRLRRDNVGMDILC